MVSRSAVKSPERGSSAPKGHLGGVLPGVFGRIRLDRVLARLAPHDEAARRPQVSLKAPLQLSPTGGLIGAGHHLLLVAPSKRSTSRWRQEERASRASNARIS